jgi:VCBS repeat-containing protein
VAQASGQLTVSDADHGEASFMAGSVAGVYGTLSLDAAGAWTYVLNNNSVAVQSLGANDLASDVVTVNTADGTSAQIAISIQGAAEANLILGTNAANHLIGTKLADQIFGRGGADMINGLAGDDTISGGTGADHFVFSGKFGHDTVTDFDTRLVREVIDLSAVSGLRGFGDLVAHHLTQVAGDAVLTFGANTITLDGVAAASLSANDFLF